MKPGKASRGAAPGLGMAVHRVRREVILAIVLGALRAASVLGQGSVSTDDGLAVTLSPAGSVTSLTVAGTEYASSSIPSGFAWRELAASPPNTAPNGSFESGSRVDADRVDVEERLVRNVDVGLLGRLVRDPLDASRRTAGPDASSPQLVTRRFPIAPDAVYTMSCRIKTLDVTYAVTMFLVEYAADGQSVQRGVASDTGTPTGRRSR